MLAVPRLDVDVEDSFCLLAHEDLVADLELVELGRERAFRHLLDEEFELGLVRARNDGEGALQDLLALVDPEGHVLAGLENQLLGGLHPD